MVMLKLICHRGRSPVYESCRAISALQVPCACLTTLTIQTSDSLMLPYEKPLFQCTANKEAMFQVQMTRGVMGANDVEERVFTRAKLIKHASRSLSEFVPCNARTKMHVKKERNTLRFGRVSTGWRDSYEDRLPSRSTPAETAM